MRARQLSALIAKNGADGRSLVFRRPPLVSVRSDPVGMIPSCLLPPAPRSSYS
jgi:hypothetical protein